MLRGLFSKIFHINPDRLLVRVSTPVHAQVNIYQYTGKQTVEMFFGTKREGIARIMAPRADIFGAWIKNVLYL
jgi:hypothetical protein